MDRGRAWRRAARERWKKRVKAHYGGYAAADPRQLGRLTTTRTPCSCWMCRSPRYAFKGKKWKLPPQEIRAIDRAEDASER